MAGDKVTVAKYSLMKQDWLCQDFILPILHCNWNLKCHHRCREKYRAYKPGKFSQGEGNEP